MTIQDQILRLVANAENAYWQVVSARENLRVQEQALALFDQSLKRAQRELELGAISELEIFQPRAQYANAEILVSQARFALQQAEDALRRQMASDLDPRVRDLPIVLTEEVAPPVQANFEKETVVDQALRLRPDLRAARQNIDIADLQISAANNALKPDLRLTAQYRIIRPRRYVLSAQQRFRRRRNAKHHRQCDSRGIGIRSTSSLASTTRSMVSVLLCSCRSVTAGPRPTTPTRS